MDSENSGPLTGVRVIDLTSVLSGPAAMATLADQGADVIKVESPAGDIMRGRGTVPGKGGEGVTPGFVSCNRGKRSVVIDLKQERAKEILWQLIDEADVFAQNFRPGAIERLGFAPEKVLARSPRLVYLSINGVGESGPFASKRVYDPVVQALSGLADIQADPHTGRPRMVRTLIADKTTAIYAAQAVTAALFARERTGKGQHVQVSMLDTMLSFLWPEGMAPFAPAASEIEEARAAPHDMIFQTADGYITVGTVSDREWRALCGALDKPEWIDDPRFATGQARSLNRQERLEAVEAAMGVRNSEQLLSTLMAADVPCAPVLGRRRLIEHPQIVANELVRMVDQPGLGEVRQARPAARMSDTPAHTPRAAPLLGEHTDSVLQSLGMTREEIDGLRQAGVIG